MLRLRATLAAMVLALGARAEGKPQIHVDHPAFDFGSTVFGQTVSHAFIVQNQGDSPLELKEVSSRCRCFHAKFDKTIAPGQAGRIRVDIDTRELEGPVFLTARVQSSDPLHPTSRLQIVGLVRGPIMLLPRDHIDLTTVAGDDHEQSIELEINREDPLEVTKVDSSSPVFVPRLETVAPGRRYRIVVTARGSQPPGVHRGTIRIRTGDGSRPIIPLECSLLVVSSVVAEPETLFLPALGEEEARKGAKKPGWKVLVKNVRGRKFSIVTLRSDLPFVRASQKARADGKSYDVFVEVLPNQLLRPGRTIGSLHIKTDLPDAQDVKVPIWVEVR
jgi:hypothetical protein